MVLKKHTNELLKIIVDEGLDVQQFTLERTYDRDIGDTVIINYNETPLYFFIVPSTVRNYFRISADRFVGNYYQDRFDDNFFDFDKVKIKFKEWLNSDVKLYIENLNEPDFWELIKNNPLTIEGIDFTKNEPLNIDEQKQLKMGLDEIKKFLPEGLGISGIQVQQINTRIDYLIEATERLNKTDWKGIAIATIIGIAYDLSLDDEKRTFLYGLFSKLWATIQQIPSSF